MGAGRGDVRRRAGGQRGRPAGTKLAWAARPSAGLTPGRGGGSIFVKPPLLFLLFERFLVKKLIIIIITTLAT